MNVLVLTEILSIALQLRTKTADCSSLKMTFPLPIIRELYLSGENKAQISVFRTNCSNLLILRHWKRQITVRNGALTRFQKITRRVPQHEDAFIIFARRLIWLNV